MNDQLALFGLEEGKRLRDEGRGRFTGHPWVREARDVAYRQCLEFGTTDAYRVQMVLPRPEHVHPNAVGAVFLDDRFEPCGWRENNREEAHGRVIRVWRLRHERKEG